MSHAGPGQAGNPITFKPSINNFLFKSGLGWLLLISTLFTMGLTLIVIGYVALRYATSTYVLDQDRLSITQGIIFRSEEEIELYRVKDAKASFSIIQQIFGNGTILIVSSDAAGAQLGGARRSQISIPNVPNARALREYIRTLVEDARNRKNVRELDMA